eukprot:SM000038S14365  [mRNA]  locus=s38:579390:585512:+ [translate_table: standard]
MGESEAQRRLQAALDKLLPPSPAAPAASWACPWRRPPSPRASPAGPGTAATSCAAWPRSSPPPGLASRRRGWINVEADLLACEGCRAALGFVLAPTLPRQQAEKAAQDFFWRLDASHKDLCPWQGNACSESLVQFPVTAASELVTSFEERCKDLAGLPSLPAVSPAALDAMAESSPAQLESLLSQAGNSYAQELEPAKSLPVITAYMQAQHVIALCGWQPHLLPYELDCGARALDLHAQRLLLSPSQHPTKQVLSSATVCNLAQTLRLSSSLLLVLLEILASGNVLREALPAQASLSTKEQHLTGMPCWDVLTLVQGEARLRSSSVGATRLPSSAEIIARECPQSTTAVPLPPAMVLACNLCGASVGLWSVRLIDRPLPTKSDKFQIEGAVPVPKDAAASALVDGAGPGCRLESLPSSVLRMHMFLPSMLADLKSGLKDMQRALAIYCSISLRVKSITPLVHMACSATHGQSDVDHTTDVAAAGDLEAKSHAAVVMEEARREPPKLCPAPKGFNLSLTIAGGPPPAESHLPSGHLPFGMAVSRKPAFGSSPKGTTGSTYEADIVKEKPYQTGPSLQAPAEECRHGHTLMATSAADPPHCRSSLGDSAEAMVVEHGGDDGAEVAQVARDPAGTAAGERRSKRKRSGLELETSTQQRAVRPASCAGTNVATLEGEEVDKGEMGAKRWPVEWASWGCELGWLLDAGQARGEQGDTAQGEGERAGESAEDSSKRAARPPTSQAKHPAEQHAQNLQTSSVFATNTDHSKKQADSGDSVDNLLQASKHEAEVQHEGQGDVGVMKEREGDAEGGAGTAAANISTGEEGGDVGGSIAMKGATHDSASVEADVEGGDRLTGGVLELDDAGEGVVGGTVASEPGRSVAGGSTAVPAGSTDGRMGPSVCEEECGQTSPGSAASVEVRGLQEAAAACSGQQGDDAGGGAMMWRAGAAGEEDVHGSRQQREGAGEAGGAGATGGCTLEVAAQGGGQSSADVGGELNAGELKRETGGKCTPSFDEGEGPSKGCMVETRDTTRRTRAVPIGDVGNAFPDVGRLANEINVDKIASPRRQDGPDLGVAEDRAGACHSSMSGLDSRREFDPLRQHRHFCPWVNTQGAPCGWQRTADALHSMTNRTPPGLAVPTTSTSSVFKVDALHSVKRLLQSRASFSKAP